MDFVHYEVDLGVNNAIRVNLGSQANVKVMDTSNFQNYRNGRTCTFYGGLAKTTPFVVRPPHGGHWHVVIDLGGYSGNIKSSVNII